MTEVEALAALRTIQDGVGFGMAEEVAEILGGVYRRALDSFYEQSGGVFPLASIAVLGGDATKQ